MGISEDGGYFVCDYCGDDTGQFNEETGNHPICEENAVHKARIKELEAAQQSAPRTCANCDHAKVCVKNEPGCGLWRQTSC